MGEKIKPFIKCNDLGSFEFWVNMFKARTEKWQRATLKRLLKSKSIFETEADREDKIKALKFILNK